MTKDSEYNRFSTGKTYNQFHPGELEPDNVINIIKKLRSMPELKGASERLGLKVSKDLAEAMLEIESLKDECRHLRKVTEILSAREKPLKEAIVDLVLKK